MVDKAPTCYGKQWEANAPECKGGTDPMYVNPQNGSHVRDKCKWYSSCAQTTTGSRVQQGAQGVIPPTNLLKPPPAPPAPSPMFAPPVPQPQQQIQRAPFAAPPVPPTMQQQPVQVMPQQYAQPQQVYHNGVMYAQPHAAAMPAMVPANHAMMGAQIPSFVTVPEPYLNDGVSHGQRLARTMFRSMTKAAAIAVANYMDYYAIGGRPPGA